MRSFLEMGSLALDGVLRRPGRNALTLLGVGIGVLALTLIVSLGEGIASFVSRTVARSVSLRQVGLSPGFGQRLKDEGEIRIEGEIDEARRRRLERAARARARPGTFLARRAQTLDDAALDAVRAMEHVETVTPLLVERYDFAMEGSSVEGVPAMGIDTMRRVYEGRLLAGRYLAGPDAREVLLHEHLAWRLGAVTQEQLDGLVGREVVITSLDAAGLGGPLAQSDLGELIEGLDLSSLSEGERQALPAIVEKLARAFFERAPAPSERFTRTYVVAGVLRDMEPGDPLDVIQDGNAVQVDLFLPEETMREVYFASPGNRSRGYRRAIVLVDEAQHAKRVEDALRDRGHSAFSVSGVVERLQGTFAAVTVAVAFLTGVALLVAALGIVNTMVTSVLERTREIGLWKALGATDGQVRAAFLLEGAMLGLLGGLLGLGAALLLRGPLDDAAQEAIAARTPFPFAGTVVETPLWLCVLGPLLATVIATLAAVYPAHRAARVDPVRALRHD